MIKLDYDKGRRQGRLICDDDLLSLIRNNFSVKNAGASFAKANAKKLGKPAPKVAERKYAITQTGLFDFGLYYEIRKYLIELQATNIQYTDAFIKELKCGFTLDEIDDSLEYPLREFQMESVRKAIKTGRGTIIIGTGGGKSLTTASLITNIWNNRTTKRFKCLVVVPGTSLVHQLVGDFEEYGVKYTYSGWTGDTEEVQDTDVLIINTENLCAKFDKINWFKEVDVVIVDECHKVGHGTKLSKILHKIKTSNMFGFTGTLSKDKLDMWKTIGTFGPILIEKRSKELRDEKYLSNVFVSFLKLIHGKNKRMGYKDELEYLYTCQPRNNLITKLANNIKNNTLILVNHHAHMDAIEDGMGYKTEKKQVFYIKGETPVEERARIIALMEECDDVVCVAMASVFSTGINIKNLHNIFIIAGGKSFIRLVQGIGRGLRLHDSKIKLTIIDMYDNLTYSESHADHRKGIYDDEQILWGEKEIKL